jgi:pimeloyl-ACP methyl ester carboxylesterase
MSDRAATTAGVPRLVCIPGAFADHRLFDRQAEAFDHIVLPRWIDPLEGDTLADYGLRLLDHNDVAPASPGSPLILVGQSFGSAIALETAPRIGAAAVVMIAGFLRREELARRLRWSTNLLRLVPSRVTERALDFLLRPAKKLDDDNPKALAADMARNFPKSVLAWSEGALDGWRGDPSAAGCPVLRIHAKDDPMIGLSRVPHVDHLIDTGGHTVNHTNPEPVNAILRELVERVAGRAQSGPDA